MPYLLPAAASAVAAAAPAAAAAGASAAASAGIGATLTSIAGNVLMNVAISAAMSVFQPQVGVAGRTFEWTLDPDGPIPFAAGRIGVPGSAVYRKTFGPDLMYYGIPSVLSGAGPIDGFEGFMADDETVAFDGSGKAVSSQYAGELWYKNKLGTQPDTAITSPTGLKNGATLPGWTSAHKLSGKASYMIVMGENSKGTAFPTGEIKPLITLRGLKVYDPRLDSTYPGGSGSHRLSNPATWTYSANPILWALKWTLGLWEGPTGKGAPQVDYQVGGIGAKLSGIDVPAFVAAANVADANGWTCAAYPTTDDDKHQVLTGFLQAGGAIYAQRAGKISCIQRAAPRTSIVTVSAYDTAGPLEIDTAASRIDRINTLRPRFWSEPHRWQMTALDQEVTAQAYRDEDGGVRPSGIDYPYVTNARQAGQLAALQIANTREGIAGVIPLKPHLQRIRPGDAFTITEAGFVLNGLKCLCLNTDYDPATGVVRVSFVSETDAKYPFALGQNPTPPTPQVLTPVDPRFVSPPGAGDWTITPRPPASGGGQLPGFDLSGVVSNDTATAIIVETGPSATGPWKQAYQGPPTVTNIPIDGLQPGATYFIAIQYQRNQNYSEREVFGPFTAPDLIAGDLSPESPTRIAVTEITDRLVSVEQISATNAAAVADLEEVFGDTVSAAASAAAASQATTDAILAKSDALQAKSDAVAAAGASASSASQAGGFKNDAEAASAAATQQKLNAIAAKDESVAKAAASATSAANAAASETAAGLSATASQTARTGAETARGQAETYRNETASARDTAVSSAATATTQAGISATSATAAQAAANTPLATSPALSPDAFSINWIGELNAPPNLREVYANNPGKIYPVNSIVEVNNFGTAVHINTAKAMARPEGHRVRYSATVQRKVDAGTVEQNKVTLFAWFWDANGGSLGGYEFYSVNPGTSSGPITLSADHLPPAGTAWTRTLLRVISHVGVTAILSFDTLDIESEKTATAAATASVASASTASTKADEAGASASAASAAKIASELARDNASGSASASATSAGQSLTYRNQAGEFASASSGSATTAATKAGEAATSASQASTSAGNANTASISAGVSATAAGRAAESTLPSTFEEGTRFFGTMIGVGLTIGDINQIVTYPTVAGIGKVVRRDGFVEYGTKGVIALKPGRKHRVRARGRVVQNGPNDTHQWVLGFQIYDANGSVLNPYWTEFSNIKRHADGWYDIGGTEPTTEQLQSHAPGATYIRPYILQGWGASVYPGSTSEVSFLRYEDVTESAAAASSAAAALTQAANATAAASSASISANLAASVGSQSSVINNGRFINWPSGQVRPTNWNDWANCNQDPNIQTGTGWNGRRFVRMNYQPSMGDQGMSQDIDGFRGTAEPYNLDIEVAIPYGGATGTGFYGTMVMVQCLDANGNYLGDADGQPRLWLEKDINGTAPGAGFGDGRIYRFNKRVNLVPGTRLVRLLLIGRSVDAAPPGANEAKTLDWYSVSLTPMSGAESSVAGLAAQLQITAATTADIATRMATAKFEVIAAAGNDPAQLLIRADNSGSLAALVATSIRFSNVVGGQIVEAMKLIGGEVFFMRPIYIDVGGSRLIVGPGGTWVLWFGATSQTAATATRTNGVFCLGTDGKVYYGTAELGGAGKANGVKRFASGAGGSAAVSTPFENTQVGSLITCTGSIDGGSLTIPNATVQGTVSIYEKASNTERLLFSRPVEMTSGELQHPNGSYDIESGGSWSGQQFGEFSGSVSYLVVLTMSGPNYFVNGATISAAVVVTPAA